MKCRFVSYSLLLLFLATLLTGCATLVMPEETPGAINATQYGLSPSNTGAQNSANLQKLIDEVSLKGGIIYIPAGEYEFAQNGVQTIGSHCIKMRSNVSIIGDGNATVLKPVGHSDYGMDMFYFNDYLDTDAPTYLENCRFENFVIDASGTSCETYTSAGKGFMINLFRNCHWKNITVKYTDATGFGVDCPLESSISDCIAIGCGKAATAENGGASGFGIGFGYSEDESIRISNCSSSDNKKFGFFFEHQGRFDNARYGAACAKDFLVVDCTASGNLYNFGGIQAMNTTYEHCASANARQHGYLFENSADCKALNCSSEYETAASFVIAQSGVDGGTQAVKNITFENCDSHHAQYGAKIIGQDAASMMYGNIIRKCKFSSIAQYTVFTSGYMKELMLIDNQSDSDRILFGAVIEDLTNTGNSWKQEE